MNELLACQRQLPLGSSETFEVRIKDIFSLLKTLHVINDHDDLLAFREKLKKNSDLSDTERQNILDATLLWLVLPHQDPQELPFNHRQIHGFLQYLFVLGASSNVASVHGMTVLMYAISNPDLLEQVLALPDNQKPMLDTVNQDGDTALILAVYNQLPFAALQLILAGADPTIRNILGKKAGMYASEFSLVERLETAEREFQLKQSRQARREEFSPSLFHHAASASSLSQSSARE